MLSKPQECSGCSLYSLGHGFSKPEGTGVNGVLIMGEALGEQEAREGLPFRPQAPAGHVLEMAIKGIGMDRQQFVLWNCIGCQPPRNELLGASYEYSALEHCKCHTRRVITQYSPRVIVACGAVPTRVLTGLTGKKLRMEDLQGFPIEAPDYPGVWVIPTYHPSYIQRGAWQVFPVLRLALKKAVKIARDGWHPPEFHCLQNASARDVEDMADELEAKPEMDLNFDFETDGGKIEPDTIQIEDGENEEDEEERTESKGAISTKQLITQVNLSIRDNEALAIDFNPNTRTVVERILGTSNNKHGHNCLGYDLPVAAHNGIAINGRLDDSMLMFHHAYPDLPGLYKKQAGDTAKEQGSYASLQFCSSFYGFPFPWKHLRLEQGHYYGCLDALSGRMVFNGAKRDLITLKVWEGYETFVRRLRPILADAERRGIPLNVEKLKAFIAMLQKREEQELAKLAPMIPEVLCPSKQKYGLRREPKDTTGLTKRTFFLLDPEKCSCVKTTKAKKCSTCKGTGSTFNADDDVEDCGVCKGAGVLNGVITPTAGCVVCGGKGEVKGDVERWCDLLPFNPNSPAQVKLYTRYEGPTPWGFKKAYAIPKNSKRKYAMDKETLERLAKMHRDPVYETILAAKSITKMKGTYGEGWLKRVDLRTQSVHTQFLFLPATGQLSSINPNVMNQPSPLKHGALAQAFAEAVEAKPGYKIIGLDYKSYHAQTLAHEALDWDYLRLARLDIHSYVAGCFLKLPGYKEALGWDDEKLGAWLKDIKNRYKKVRDAQAKPAVLGYGFNLGATRLFNSNPDSFGSVREAERLFEALNAAFPRAARYRTETPDLAHRQKYLRSPFSCIRWFWNVKTYNFRKKEWDHGMDYDKSIAFRPANNAFCQKKIAMLACEEQGYMERYGFNFDLHDALYFHCADSLVDECLHQVKTEMERPSTVLLMPDGTGFSVAVEAKVGSSMATLQEVKV
jgi:uracil-DNA glycosylase